MMNFLFPNFTDDTSDTNVLLEQLGSVLIWECTDERLIRAFKSLGGTFHDFLTTLDGVHDVIQSQEEEKEEDSSDRVSVPFFIVDSSIPN